MTLHADRIGRRALTVGAAAGSILAATLTFAATQADAAYTAQVKAGTLQIRGDGASDKLLLAPTPTTLVLDVGEDGTTDFTFDRSTFTAVNVQAGDGDDEVRVLNAATPLGHDDRRRRRRRHADRRQRQRHAVGGSGNDFVDGNIGADTARLGSGDDTFQWDPGDGSDSVDGQLGTDTLTFNGSNIGEEIHVAGRHAHDATSPRSRWRSTASRTSTCARSAAPTSSTSTAPSTSRRRPSTPAPTAPPTASTSTAPTATTSSPSAPGAVEARRHDRQRAGDGVRLTCEVAVGGAGDDTATYTGTAGDDQISFGRNAADTVFVATGGTLLANLQVDHTVLKGLGGNDLIAGQNGIAALTQVTLDGGAGDDDLRGGDGNDILLGGSGNDHVDGNIGADTALMGTGNDRFQWDPGDGSDSVDGQDGTDALDFNGSNIGEAIHVSGHQLTRNVAAITMDYTVEGVNVPHARQRRHRHHRRPQRPQDRQCRPRARRRARPTTWSSAAPTATISSCSARTRSPSRALRSASPTPSPATA